MVPCQWFAVRCPRFVAGRARGATPAGGSGCRDRGTEYRLPLCLMAMLVCGTPAARGAEWAYPVSMAVDPSGVVYLADRDLPGIWRWEREQLTLFYRAEKGFRSPLGAVRCVALDTQGRLLAGDSAAREVYRFDEQGRPEPLTAPGQSVGLVRLPMAIVADPRGDLLVADLERSRIVKIPAAGGVPEELASVPAPRGLCLDAQQRLWVVSGRRLIRLLPDGGRETVVDEGIFQFPQGVAVAGDGTAYVADGWAQTIWRVAPEGQPQRWVEGKPLDHPVALVWHEDRLLVIDPRARALLAIDRNGKIDTFIQGGVAR